MLKLNPYAAVQKRAAWKLANKIEKAGQIENKEDMKISIVEEEAFEAERSPPDDVINDEIMEESSVSRCESPVFQDVVVLLDGSDSFNRTLNSEAFEEAQKFVFTDLAPKLAEKFGENCGISLVQFSGIKKLTKPYIPGSDGKADESGLLAHWQIECEHINPSEARAKPDSTSFDGNGQLFLCLQDVSLDNFIENLESKLPFDGDRKRSLVVITDDEWDLNELKTPEGSEATEEQVTKRAKERYEIFPIIVRDQKISATNEDFIENELASKPENVQKVFAENFEDDLTQAFSNVVDSI